MQLQDLLVGSKTVTFDDWLQGRVPAYLSTNNGTPLAAFQAWRAFKEAFAPELVAQAFEETSAALGRPITKSIDPFGGSGTTALASQFLNVAPTTVEVNPYLADLIEAKLCTYDAESLLDDYSQLLDRVTQKSGSTLFPGAPETFISPGKNGKYIFSLDVARRLSALKEAIMEVSHTDHRRLFRILLAPVAIAVSNVVVSGKGRRYRRNWEQRQSSPQDVLNSFDEGFTRAIYDIQRFRNRKCLDYSLIRGDARELTPLEGNFEVAVLSPPYPNSFDYTDVYNVELWVCGYLDSNHSNRALRMSTLRSHVQIKRSFDGDDVVSETLPLVEEKLNNIRHLLWNKSIPDMVRAYFFDMQSVIGRLAFSITDGGRMYLVVGDSQYHGVQIPVARILTEIARNFGFRELSNEPFRSMRASPQQGGKAELTETLLTFERS